MGIQEELFILLGKFLTVSYFVIFPSCGIYSPSFCFSFVSLQQIHALVMSLNLTAIEIKTINSLDSWNGGVLVMVSGSVKTKDFVNRRIFVQTFFLAPQEKGYYVLNDIFLFVDDGAAYQQDLPPENIHMQHPAPISSDETFDAQLDSSSPLPEAPGNRMMTCAVKH